MSPRSKHLRIATLPLAALLAATGCRNAPVRNDCAPCADIPHGALPQPAGTYLCQWQRAQMDLAEEDDFVVYEAEWRGLTTDLGPYGQQHLAAIAQRLPQTPFLVVIVPRFDVERNQPDEALNMARRMAYVEALAHAGVPDADQRVVIGGAKAEGLLGEEAARYGFTRAIGGDSRGGAGGGYGGGFGGGYGSGAFGGGFY
jgi:hypothetical protein